MKYPCNLIQDLLPLYYDGICSQESREIIEAHLQECPACKKYLAVMREADKAIEPPPNEEREKQKAASFCSVRKKLKQKQLLITLVCIIVLLLGTFAGIGVLQNTSKTIIYNDNISVSMANNNLVSRLSGSVWHRCKSVTVTIQENRQTKTYLFFYLTDTLWDDLTTSPGSFTEYTLCPSDKGADHIDSVYYYTGDYDGIETMEPDKLDAVITNATLLWSK